MSQNSGSGGGAEGFVGRFDAEVSHDELSTMNQEEIDALILGENAGGSGVGGEKAGEFLAWGDIQSHILDAFLDGDEKWDSEQVVALARRLRAPVQDLIDIFEATDPTVWSAKRFDKLLERESMSKRGYSWDRIEHAALTKLTTLIEKNRITSAGDLLAVAKVANNATRSRVPTPPNGNGGVNVQINQFGGGMAPELPGPGSLGTIQLTLTQRTVSQLGRERVIDGESQRLSESAQMLGPEDIPELSQMTDKGRNP